METNESVTEKDITVLISSYEVNYLSTVIHTNHF